MPWPTTSEKCSCGPSGLFIWIAPLMVRFRCLFDMFGDHTLSGWAKAGWAKAGWAVMLIFGPCLG